MNRYATLSPEDFTEKAADLLQRALPDRDLAVITLTYYD